MGEGKKKLRIEFIQANIKDDVKIGKAVELAVQRHIQPVIENNPAEHQEPKPYSLKDEQLETVIKDSAEAVLKKDNQKRKKKKQTKQAAKKDDKVTLDDIKKDVEEIGKADSKLKDYFSYVKDIFVIIKTIWDIYKGVSG